MRHIDHRGQLEVNLQSKECELPQDQLTRLQEPLDQIAAAVGDLPATLALNVVRHPNSSRFHVEAAMQLPRRSVFTGEWDEYLDTALARSLRKLRCKIEAYKQEPDRQEDLTAQRTEAMNRNIVAPEDPDAGALGQAVAAADFRRFRQLLAQDEDWLRLRVGRWVQRYPAVDAAVGSRFTIPDIVEEVILNAFEHYSERPQGIPLHEWLEQWIDPSLQAFWTDPSAERQNVSFARTLRETASS